ncbi:MAG TPA: peroxiredoxin-like family protein [Terriglobales bacterium]|nr:peroxiredoxin-like family protein [Terriglobales bacterium]
MKWRSIPESGSYSDLRPLREVFAERKEAIAKYVPPDVQAIHQRTIDTLKAEAFATMALASITTVPSFELPDHNGKRVSSADLLSKGRVVLCFVRGRWCPFCVGQLEAMNYIASQVANAGAQIVAISPQTEKQAYFMHDQHKLTFPLLADARNELARQFGLVYKVPEEQLKLYRSTFINLPFINGDDSWELPIPATYIFDRDGTILFASANEDYTVRPEPLDILSFLEHSV